MAKYRVWAECISDVYLDVEANSKEEALNIAAETDGREFIDAGTEDWNIVGAIKYGIQLRDRNIQQR